MSVRKVTCVLTSTVPVPVTIRQHLTVYTDRPVGEEHIAVKQYFRRQPGEPAEAYLEQGAVELVDVKGKELYDELSNDHGPSLEQIAAECMILGFDIKGIEFQE